MRTFEAMDLTGIISSIHEAAEMLSNQAEVDPQQRAALLQACEKLSAIVEQPRSRLEKATHAVNYSTDVKLVLEIELIDTK